jgi:hypothetical protein
VTNREIDELLEDASLEEMDPSRLANITALMRKTMVPVNPRPASWVLSSSLVGVCGVISAIGASLLGFQGIRRLGMEKIGLIFSVLLLFMILAAAVSVAEIVPGSRRIADPRFLCAVSMLALLTVFGLLFHDFSTFRLVPQGMACLKVGSLVAIPAGAASWLILRRGFAVDTIAAGLAAGTLAGLAGVVALELHCPNFRALHVMIWHTAVLAAGASGGALLGWWNVLVRSRRNSRSHALPNSL